ncbi:aldose epimerase family protein [Actinacidiphila guanduensis]|uniref:Aldose 1-epimerase n=1 Tax=Actinacidiphila guanduensis TaxID=310781 RepID=A0A1H0P492_9ACTN|nr:aldose epimerase [Actinacidiphila guanduensis]SDO99505.1 aldose 1-epimerase [Actinacidiphila guanduensis]
MENETKLTAGDAELTLRPDQGCRIASLKVGGTELLRQGDKFGAFVMVPWCGRTENGRFRNGGVTHQLPVDAPPHAIHGTGRHSVWQPASPATGTSAAFYYDLADPWPYPGRVTHTVELAPHSVTLHLSVEARGDSFPAQAGWHPWWRRNLGQGGQDVELAFTAAWQEERGENHLPDGNRIDPKPGPWDDCFGMPDGVDVALNWPGEMTVRVTSPSQWVVVYTEQPEAVCVEPQSGPPNGLNTLPRLVTPIEPLEISTVWSWQKVG